ncbi:MAG: GNAT family N-acetyltransferase [Myxococcales bacterium]|nr:MAG: GNAT family N-acetyltransferase [Myxococcales bacterium]
MPTKTATPSGRDAAPLKVIIRYATDSDMPKVWRLDRLNLEENWDIHPTTGYPLSPDGFARRHREGIQRWFSPENHRVIVAEADGEIVGLAWYGMQRDSVFDFEVGFLYSIVVDPRWRRLGLARKLLEEFKRRAALTGAKLVRLAVLHNNYRAINLYRKLGFFDETHYMLARLEPTAPEKAKSEAKARKTQEAAAKPAKPRKRKPAATS